MALSKIGAQTINSLQDQTNNSSIQCNVNFQLAYLEVSRATKWNCILATAVLTQVQQTPLPGTGTATPPTSVPWTANTPYTQGQYLSYGGQYYTVLNNYTSSSSITTDVTNGNLAVYNNNGNVPVNATPWAPNTPYQAGAYLSYGNYYYEVLFSYLSTNNFQNDLTSGALAQTNLPTTQPFFGYYGQNFASGWQYQYELPSDFQLLCGLNENTYWGWQYYGDSTSNYEIIGQSLYCNEPQAVIQYVQNVPDTTRFDSLFLNCFVLKLASMIATPLRQDGGALEKALLAEYKSALRDARTKNSGERQQRRFNPIGSSLFNRSRYGGTNG